MSKNLACSLLFLAATACTSVKESRLAVPQDSTVVATPAAIKPVTSPKPAVAAKTVPKGKAECPVSDIVCTMDYRPALCTAQSYEGRTLEPQARFMAWGTNTCEGRIKLAKEVCASNQLPSKLGGIECVPDPSNGHCGVSPPPCGTAIKPATCTAKGYGSQTLSDEQVLTATATNECLSHAELRRLACRANLDPLQLNQISCTVGQGSK